MGGYRRWSKTTIKRQLGILKNKIDLRLTGKIDYWAVRMNCDRSGCHRRYGQRHHYHGHIYTFSSESAARGFLNSRGTWHSDDLLHRVVIVPSWEILNPAPNHGMETTDLTDI